MTFEEKVKVKVLSTLWYIKEPIAVVAWFNLATIKLLSGGAFIGFIGTLPWVEYVTIYLIVFHVLIVSIA